MRLLLLLLVTIPAWAQFGAARQVVNGNGAPSASLCASSNNVGLVYARKDGEAAYSTFYVCANTAAATYEWELMGAGGGGGGVSSVSATGGVQTSSGAAITSTGTVRGAYVANAQTGTTYTVLTGDRGKVVTFSNAGAIAVTLPQAGTGFEDGWFVIVKNIGAGDVTITPTTSTISGAASIVLSLGEFALITSNGTNYESVTNRVRVDSSLVKTSSRSAGVEIGAGPSLVTLTGNQTLTDKTLSSSSNSIGPIAIKNYASGAGTGQAQEITLTPALPSYDTGATVCWLPAAANTGPGPTVDVDGLGTKTITKFGTTPLVAGDITTTAVACAIYDGTQFELQNPQTSMTNIQKQYYCEDDFVSVVAAGTANLIGGSCGVGAVFTGASSGYSASAGEATAPGIVQITTGTDTTGNSSVRSINVNSILFGSAIYTTETRARITTLSDGTNTYTLTSGFMDLATASTDGCYFAYTHGTNSGNWQGICRSNSTETALNTSTAASAGSWVKLRVVVTNASLAEFFINDTSVGTIATNIPSGTGRETGWRSLAVLKSAGTTPRTFDIDYTTLQIQFGTAR